MSLSQNIRKLRLKKGMTQEQLAVVLGVSAQAVSKWETSETYPDGTLLVPVANALGVSLDVLFENKACSMQDISVRIRNLLSAVPRNQQFHLVRDLCWQIEKALFYSYIADGNGYSPDEINTRTMSSYISNNHGFTHISNGRAPFFSVFPEYADGFSEVIGDGEEMRKLFEALASPEAMRALLFIYRNQNNYVFEAEVMADACGIEDTKIQTVLHDFMELHLVYVDDDVELDGEKRTLYHTNQRHEIIALLLFAHELNYQDGYCLQADLRNKPYLK